MRTKSRQLKLNREVVRELDAGGLAGAAGAAGTLPPTFCQCTGTETATNVCCILSYDVCIRALQTLKGCNLTIPPTFCACTGTETATNICCVN